MHTYIVTTHIQELSVQEDEPGLLMIRETPLILACRDVEGEIVIVIFKQAVHSEKKKLA